ncbi:diguanylate cyclase [Bradyrhizobium lablabi]|uniref:diguanylate cyclase n=2 Tax=Bradyrhizobium TaxID=374 RepID=A0ABY0QGV6_9BRAD|nr:diguanylate cyclase [Bradyrhizobium ottawaense]SEE36913.1 diguanylate cyclase [Bradyrhizobium lablabi]
MFTRYSFSPANFAALILVIAAGQRAALLGIGDGSVVKLLDEHERTMAFAEVALGQIKSLRQTAVPRNYEIWYVYATGYNAALNKIINETLARNGKLSESDLEQIYETYLSHIKTSDRIDKVGARVIGEIDDVMTLITEALGMSATYDASLTGATQKLSAAQQPDQIKAVVEQLVKSTQEMRETNKALETRLLLSKTEISNLQHSLEAIRAESLTDPLTGLGNRKYFDRSIDMAVQTALASGEPLSLLMFDIDHFKSFNDSYGHLTGDQVLRLVGMSLKQTIKGQDITARYGGEEFAVVLPNTALRQALTVADHIRRAVMAKELKKKSTGEILGRVTISVGVSMLKPGDDTDSLIERADACLYAAKRNGRNRVICEVDPEYAAETRSQVA